MEPSFHIEIEFALAQPAFAVKLPRYAPCEEPDFDPNPGRNYKITQVETLADSVFRCRLDAEDLQRPNEPSTVILKTAVMPDIERMTKRETEAARYNHYLRHLQGNVVPRFLGFFKGAYDDCHWACLLLEDCGTPLTRISWDTEDHKIQLGNALASFHLGAHPRVKYCNISPRHTLISKKDGRFRVVLINFMKLEEHSDCKFSDVIQGVSFSDIINKHLPDPGLELIGCTEIHDYCVDRELVVPSEYTYRMTSFTMTSDIRTREQLLDKVRLYYNSPRDKKILPGWSRQTWAILEPHIAKYSQAPWTTKDTDAGHATVIDEGGDEGGPSRDHEEL